MNINVLAPCNSLGYGLSGANIVSALSKLGHHVSLWPIGPVEVSERLLSHIRAAVDRTKTFDNTAPSLRVWHQFGLAEHIGKGLHCALPIFELTRFKPNEIHHLKAQDVIFVPSHWAGLVLEDSGIQSKNIQYAPLGVDADIFRPREQQQVHGAPTTFLNVGKFEVRKGHDVLIDAFCKAFTKDDNVQLVMLSHNPCFRTQEEIEQYNLGWVKMYLSSPMGEANKVGVVQKRLPTQADVATIMATADCGVFPARAEGWNLDLAEMMTMDKHAIATNYSAHTEFCNAANAHLVEIDTLEDAHDGVWFDASDSSWQRKPGQWAALGESQIDQLVEHMRRIHKLKQSGELTPNLAGVETMKHFTWESTAREIVSVLS